MNQNSESIRRENPYERTNIFSKYLYWWMLDFFKIDLKRPFSESDLYQPLNAHRSQKLADSFEKLWNNELKTESPSFLRVLRKRFGTSVLILGFLFSVCDSTAK